MEVGSATLVGGEETEDKVLDSHEYLEEVSFVALAFIRDQDSGEVLGSAEGGGVWGLSGVRRERIEVGVCVWWPALTPSSPPHLQVIVSIVDVRTVHGAPPIFTVLRSCESGAKAERKRRIKMC